MKKLLPFLFLGLILTACSRSNDLVENDPGLIEFNLYGQTKTYTEASGAKTQITGTNVLTFHGVKEPRAENSFTLSFPAGDMQPGTYSVNTGVVTFREGDHVVSNVTDTDFTVTIASNEGGVINGTFSGTLYDHTSLSNCTLVQGKIQNIMIR